jgi:hypothetical protein
MRTRLAAAALLALVPALACRREKAAGGRPVPAGDAIWFAEGLGSDSSSAEEVLGRGGLAHVFLPVLRLNRVPGAWTASELPLPSPPLAALPIVLVVEGDADFAAALLPGSEDPPAAAIADALKHLLERRSALGKVEGVHLDLPFSQATVESFGVLAARLRAQLPADLFLSCSLRFSPAEKEREDFDRSLAPVDGFVAFVFGDGAHADVIATDALGKPWWAGYVPGARAVWSDAAGNSRGTLNEKFLLALTDDTRVSLGHDLALRDEGAEGFIFRPTAPVEIGGLTFSPGDQISFQQPVLSDLLYRFGSDLAGRRFVRGRLVVLDGTSESERVLTLTALSDVLLGRPLLPDLRVAVTPDASGMHIAAENRSSHASVVSRTVNWIDVDVPGGHIRDVQLGGFDRYEVFDPEGRPVTPGRATRVRFHEILVGPHEKIEGAAVLLRGKPAADCCRYRQHTLAAAGTEIAGDWSEPPKPPTPTPAPKSKSRLKPKRR